MYAAGALDYRGSLRKYVVGTGKARSAAAARAKFKLGPIINYNRCTAPRNGPYGAATAAARTSSLPFLALEKPSDIVDLRIFMGGGCADTVPVCTAAETTTSGSASWRGSTCSCPQRTPGSKWSSART